MRDQIVEGTHPQLGDKLRIEGFVDDVILVSRQFNRFFLREVKLTEEPKVERGSE